MYIRKFLQRGDAASVVVAVVLAMILVSLITTVTIEPTSKLVELLGGSEQFGFSGVGWQDRYVAPLVSALLQVLALELVLRLVVPIRGALVRRKR